MIKVLFLIPTLSYGGAEKVLVNLANNMNTDKFDVTIQTLFDVGVNRQYIKPHVHYIGGLRKAFKGNSFVIKALPPRLLYKYIVKNKYDVIVSYLEGSTTRILSGCADTDIKRVAWVHIELNDKKSISNGFFKSTMALKAYRSFNKVICVSETVKKAFESTAGEQFSNICVLYNTNETSKIMELALESVDDVVFKNDTVNVCSVGKITPTKGYDRLIEVHRHLIDEGFKHHIYILGVGEQKAELEQKLKEYGLEESFTFLGFRDNPYKYVAKCDLYVCSSHREGFSTAVTESLIVGTPVVSTCCSGAYELLGKNNEYGIVTENSEEGIYQGMRQMLESEVKRRYYADMALEQGKKFSTQKTVEAVEEMLNSL